METTQNIIYINDLDKMQNAGPSLELLCVRQSNVNPFC